MSFAKPPTPRVMSDDEMLYEAALRTVTHSGPNGCGQRIRYHTDDRLVDEVRDERYINCPCGRRFVLAIGGFKKT